MPPRHILGTLAAAGVLVLGAVPVALSNAAGASSPPPSQAVGLANYRAYPLAYAAAAEQQRRYLGALAWIDGLDRPQVGVQRRGGHGHGCAPGDFQCFRACTINRESHGNYTDASANGQYRGAWQFNQSTWDSNAAASGHPELVGTDPAAASPQSQDAVAQATYSARGKSAWGGRC
jgi:hypothetical protein